MRFRRRLRTLALLAGLAAAASSSPGRALADEATGTGSVNGANGANSASGTNAANVIAARDHFEKARAFYGRGSYREAVAELEAAHTLDPSAKDLVFNLGVVHEKLSDIDEALQWFELYTTMSLTPQERERADAYIKRLQGAKKEVPQPTETSTPALLPGAPPPAPDAPPMPAEPGRRGRVDAATIIVTGIAGGVLLLSTAVGIKALVDRPSDSYVLGKDGNYADLTHQTNFAHDEARVADVGFGITIAAGVTAAILYFGRTRDAPTAARPPKVSVAPLVGGGALVVQGSL